jgi:5,10-methylenetetrahydromethanopterin reductase
VEDRQFAIAIPTDADSWRVVRSAEELGFARAWFYDTQMLSADPFVAMAVAAIRTTKIRLGTGVLIPSKPDCAGRGECLRLIE